MNLHVHARRRRAWHPCRAFTDTCLRPAGFFVLFTLFVAFVLPACKRDDMADQPRYKPLAASSFFRDGKSARPLPTGTIPRTAGPNTNTFPWTEPLPAEAALPFAITRQDLQRGREQFNIFCTPCHGMLGDGNGMIVQRGFTRPPSFHIDRLRSVPPSYVHNVITNGIGAMFSYADRVSSDDRWRIAAYIKVLQYSRHVPLSDLPPEDRQKLEGP